MNNRSNRKRILAKLQTKKKYHWYVQTIIKDSEKRTISRLKIQALIDKSFPELVGVKA